MNSVRITETKNKITALKLARRLLVTHKKAYICASLSEVATRSAALTNVCSALRDFVMDALDDYAYLDSWIRSHRPDYGTSEDDYRKARIMWIDWMIKQLQIKLQGQVNE